MKPDIHPDYRSVVFQDPGAEFAFLTRSTIETKETIEWEDGNTYPLYKVDISSASHPFFTGTMRIVDTAGRVERFQRRFGQRKTRKGAELETPEAEVVAEVVEAEVVASAPETVAEAEAPEAQVVAEAPEAEAEVVAEAPAESKEGES